LRRRPHGHVRLTNHDRWFFTQLYCWFPAILRVHGAYCVGCCWVLMALLFVGGVMNVVWIALLALLVLLEKVTPFGGRVARAAGVACVAAGIWMLSSSPQ